MPEKEPKTVEKWADAGMGDRVHVDRLLEWVPVVHFLQLEKGPGEPSYCEAPTMTFRCEPSEMPYYTRIE